MAAEPRVYVYALAAGPLPHRFRIGSHVLQTIRIGKVAAVVEQIDAVPPASAATLREQHDLVIALAKRVQALLPVRFGALVPVEELGAQVRTARGIVGRALKKVAGRVQMTVRVVQAPARGPRVRGSRPGTAYLAARRTLGAADDALVQAIHRTAAPLVAAEKIERRPTMPGTTIFHLIERAHVEAYQRAIEAVVSATAGGRVTVSGPWPPFAFAPEVL